jgi:hypothetical protein
MEKNALPPIPYSNRIRIIFSRLLQFSHINEAEFVNNAGE